MHFGATLDLSKSKKTYHWYQLAATNISSKVNLKVANFIFGMTAMSFLVESISVARTRFG